MGMSDCKARACNSFGGMNVLLVICAILIMKGCGMLDEYECRCHCPAVAESVEEVADHE